MTKPVIAGTKMVYVTPVSPLLNAPIYGEGRWSNMGRPMGAPCLIETANPGNVWLFVPGQAPALVAQNFLNPNLICYDDAALSLVEFRGNGTLSIGQLYPNLQTMINRVIPVPSAWQQVYEQFSLNVPFNWADPYFIYPSASFSGRGGNFGISYPGGGGYQPCSLIITELLSPGFMEGMAVGSNLYSSFGVGPNTITTLPGQPSLYLLDAANPDVDLGGGVGFHFIAEDVSSNYSNVMLPAVNSSMTYGQLFNGYVVTGPPDNSKGLYYTEDFINLYALVDGSGFLDFSNFVNTWAGGFTTAWGAQHLMMASDPLGGIANYFPMSLITLEKVSLKGNSFGSNSCGCGK